MTEDTFIIFNSMYARFFSKKLLKTKGSLFEKYLPLLHFHFTSQTNEPQQ